MVRQWTDITTLDANLGFSVNASLILWLWIALVTFSIMSAIIFTCSDGVSKDRTTSAADSELYGAGCAAPCGAACGA